MDEQTVGVSSARASSSTRAKGDRVDLFVLASQPTGMIAAVVRANPNRTEPNQTKGTSALGSADLITPIERVVVLNELAIRSSACARPSACI